MTQPAVNLSTVDGALGVLPPSEGQLLAFVGPSTIGTANTPASFARVSDLVAAFGAGNTVQAAAHAIERYGKPVVFVKSGDTTSGSASSVTFTGTGTSVVSVASSPDPNDDYEIYLLVVAGGTIGVAGITYKLSLDGGRTLSATTALGTANSLAIPGAGTLTLNFAAGTLVAGDLATCRANAQNFNAAEVNAAIDALVASSHTWELLEICGNLDATLFDSVELAFAEAFAAGKNHAWVGHFRMPNLAESEATYLTAFNTAFSAKATTCGAVTSGHGLLTSSVDGRKYRRPFSFVAAAREASVSQEVNTADVNLGPFTAFSLRDANGNSVAHDESLNPGLDDSRSYVARSWEGLQGVYVNRPRLLSATGSDFQLLAHRRVFNIALDVLRAYFLRRLNKPIRVNAATGFILEADALEIEAGARAVMRTALLSKPKASGIQFALSRTDNLLSTKTMTGDARIIPLAYPETINLTVGFLNPALQIQAV